MLIGWLEAGGHLLLLTDVVEEGAMPNLARVAGYMGMRQDAGMVLEGDPGSYWSQPYYLLPDMASHAITDPLIEGRYAVLAPYAQPIEATQDEAEVTFLLHTSDNSYVKAAGYDLETLEQEEADEMGPFGIAAGFRTRRGAHGVDRLGGAAQRGNRRHVRGREQRFFPQRAGLDVRAGRDHFHPRQEPERGNAHGFRAG